MIVIFLKHRYISCNRRISTYILKQGIAGNPANEEGKVNREAVERVLDGGDENQGKKHADGRHGEGKDEATVVGAIKPVEKIKESGEETEDDAGAAKLQDSEARRDDLVSGACGARSACGSGTHGDVGATWG